MTEQILSNERLEEIEIEIDGLTDIAHKRSRGSWISQQDVYKLVAAFAGLNAIVPDLLADNRLLRAAIAEYAEANEQTIYGSPTQEVFKRYEDAREALLQLAEQIKESEGTDD